jgi:hypothetical protein
MSRQLPSSRGKPFQSKLNAVASVIATLRRQRQTYAVISQILQEQHGIHASPSTIFSFVKVRSKKRRSPQPVEMFSPLSASDTNAIERLQHSKPAETPRTLFTFDETKPLTLK